MSTCYFVIGGFSRGFEVGGDNEMSFLYFIPVGPCPNHEMSFL